MAKPTKTVLVYADRYDGDSARLSSDLYFMGASFGNVWQHGDQVGIDCPEDYIPVLLVALEELGVKCEHEQTEGLADW